MILPHKKKHAWEKLGINPDKMKAYLDVRRKPLKRLSGWFVVAGVVFAVQTTYALDPQKNLVARQVTFVDHASAGNETPRSSKFHTATFVFLTVTGSNQSYPVPSNWNNGDNKVECIGAGGGGGSSTSTGNAGGGGGGAYAASSNLSLTPGNSVIYCIGSPGIGGAVNGHSGTTGGDTWFNASSFDSSTVGAKGGTGGAHAENGNVGSNGVGGSSSSSRGTTKRAGGNAGPCGGGAGGPNGAGVAGGSSAGGAGDAGYGGAGGSGAGSLGIGHDGFEMGGGSVGAGGGGNRAGSNGTGNDGGKYGGGGGPGHAPSGFSSPGGDGAQGIIVITYTPLVAPTVTAISPNSGLTVGGDSVTITGTDFTGATAVMFGADTAASFNVVSSTTITAVTGVPSGGAGTVDVSVTTPGGTGSKTNGFTFKTVPLPIQLPYIYGV